jgi:hypothetical protein
MRHVQWIDVARNTKKIYQAKKHQNDLREDPRLDGQIMQRMT